MSEIKTWDMRAGKRWPEASEIIEATQAEINELLAALAERDAKGKTMIDFKLQATGIPESIEQYQLALDAAFNVGKAIAAGPAGLGNTVRDAADEIDRLRTEAVAADIRIGNDALVIAELRAERDALARCKLADQDAYVAMRDQRDALQAKLAALEKQEPVAWVGEVSECATLLIEKPFWNAIPLYAAAPVPEGWQLVPVEPTDAMLASARDWSYAKYGKPIGNAAAVGCWEAMLAAAPKEQA